MTQDTVILIEVVLMSLATIYLIARIKTLESVVIDLLWLAENGSFKNGNTDPTGSIDEGEVHAYNMLKDARKRFNRKCPWE